MARKKQHYVDNEKFLGVMREYREDVLRAKDNDEEKPPLPEFAGECILKIAEKLSYRPNFINYAFREEMVCDGIENCVMYASNFDPEKSSNPFAYFTQIIYYAFLRRIDREKKQLYIKYKTMDEHNSIEDNSDFVDDDLVMSGSPLTQDRRNNIYEFIDTFEKKKTKKKRKSSTKTSMIEVSHGSLSHFFSMDQ